MLFMLALSAGCAAPGQPAFAPANLDHTPASPGDATYLIEGRAVTLSGGTSDVEAAPGAASRIVTRYAGREAWHDLDGDGREDVAFLLTQQTGGSGTFYYVVAALHTERGFVGSHAWFLGDRIVPQTIQIARTAGLGPVIIVTYADRAPGESLAAVPTTSRRVWLRLDSRTMRFEEVR